MTRNYKTGILIVLTCAFMSCKKPAGEGGQASIRGKVWVEDWNAAFTIKNGEYAAADEDVFIIYGDDLNYGRKVSTTYTGEFEFKYLQKGRYRIYVYSKDKTLKSQSGDTTFVKEAVITDKKQVITLEPFIIYK
jgi:hypothetical protein